MCLNSSSSILKWFCSLLLSAASMAEGEQSKKVRPKEKNEPANFFTGEAATAAAILEVVNVTSLANIFDTAFTSTADPASHPRYPSG